MFVPKSLYNCVGLVHALAAEVPSGAGVTTILKDLSAVLLFAVALAVKVLVVDELTLFGSPVIAPLEEFKLKPPGSEPDVIEYAIVSPSASDAVIVA